MKGRSQYEFFFQAYQVVLYLLLLHGDGRELVVGWVGRSRRVIKAMCGKKQTGRHHNVAFG